MCDAGAARETHGGGLARFLELNMIDAAIERFPGQRLKAVVGGFHLTGLPSADSMALSRPEVEEIGRAVRSRCDGPVFTGHCTGHKAFPFSMVS